jgi:hypothetical protein
MTKQELLPKMMDGEWWTHESWDEECAVNFDDARFIFKNGNTANIFALIDGMTDLEGFHHYEEPKEQVEAWRWLFFDKVCDKVLPTLRPYQTPEKAQKSIGSDCIVLHKCEETLTMIDKE